MHLELHAYQTHAFLDWRDLHEDAAHPWGELCDALAGRGVSSLEDALRDLQLKPVHEALRNMVDPALAKSLADCTLLKMKKGAQRASHAASALKIIRQRAGVLLAEAERYSCSAAGKDAGVSADHHWRTNAPLAQEDLLDRVNAALKLPALCKDAAARWPAEAHAVLPLSDGPYPQTVTVWSALLGWCAMEAIGRLQDPAKPEAAAAQLFDALRLRQPLAKAFAADAVPGEEDWRMAARLRASFAHSSRANAPFSWIHDPDVAWVIGVHQHEGVSYLVKEHFERLLWWMAMPRLLEIAGQPKPDLDKLDLIAEEISQRMQAVANGGYRVEALEESAPLDGLREREGKLQKETQEP